MHCGNEEAMGAGVALAEESLAPERGVRPQPAAAAGRGVGNVLASRDEWRWSPGDGNQMTAQ